MPSLHTSASVAFKAVPTPFELPRSSAERAIELTLILWSAATSAALVVLAGTDSFWADELTSYWFSSGEQIGSVLQRMVERSDPHPPGYQLLLFLSYQLPGFDGDPLGARSLSIVAYLVTLFCGTRLLSRTSGSSMPGLVYGVLLGSASYVAFYGTELRSYMSQQAALMALLLVRKERATERRPYLHVIEQLIAFYLGSSHYVASLMTGILAVCGAARAFTGQRTLRATLPECGYLVGPLTAVTWLLCGPERENFRELAVPDANQVASYFVNALGPSQSLVLFVLTLVALGVATGPSSSSGRPLSPSLLGTGVGEALLLFCALLASLPVQTVLQQRNVLLILPPLLCALSLLLTSTLRGRSALVLWVGLLVMGWAGFGNYRKELASPQRAGSDFLRIAELSQSEAVVVATEDIRRKVVDAGRLHTPPLVALSVVALRTDPAGARTLLRRHDKKLILACPHCRASAHEMLKAFQKNHELRCRKEKPAARDTIYRCT